MIRCMNSSNSGTVKAVSDGHLRGGGVLHPGAGAHPVPPPPPRPPPRPKLVTKIPRMTTAPRVETVAVRGSPMEVFLFAPGKDGPRPVGAGPQPGLVLCQHIPAGH